MGAKIVLFSTSTGMTRRCREVLARRKHTEIPIFELTTSFALEEAEKGIREGTRVIICRGGTAEYLHKHLEIPIVDIRHSFLSVFLSVKELRKNYQKLAVIGFRHACEAVEKYNIIMHDDVLVYKVESADQFERKFQEAVKKGAEVILGGFLIADVCRDHNFPYFSVEPDDSEISQALEEALYSLRIEEERSQQYSLISAILNSTSEGIVGIDRSGRIFHINRIARSLLHYTGDCPISELMPSEKIMNAAAKGENFFSELITVRGVGVVCGCQAIQTGGEASGAVLTLQEENTIRTLDSQIRKKQLGRGHVAKIDFSDLVGHSPALFNAKNTAKRYARSGGTVLITGETGTGKEMFAQGIHNYGIRRHEPFVAINCAALPQDILESELFGYVRGAFTGAKSEGKPGIFELAHKGTVFLDEISEMSIDVQVKLLRVLQEKEVTRIGDDKVIPVDVRILAACNTDLLKSIAEGRFREDLYYRVCVLELQVPPLRDRTEDIPELVRHFMRGRKSLTLRAEELLKNYSWPGNIRQLANITERLDVLCDNNMITNEDIRQVLRIGDQPSRSAAAESGPPTQAQISEGLLPHMEERLIRDSLARAGGSRKKAAAELGLSKTTLWRRMKQFDLQDKGSD